MKPKTERRLILLVLGLMLLMNLAVLINAQRLGDGDAGYEALPSSGIDEPSPECSREEGFGEPDEVVEVFESGPGGEDR